MITYARLAAATSLALALLCTIGAEGRAQTGSVGAVSAQSNIFRADGNAPTLDGIDPFLVYLTAIGTGRTATFSASGLWNCCNGVGGYQGPDGGFTGNPPTNITSWNRIAGISGPGNMWLVGLFLGSTLPLSAPTSRSYSSLSASAYTDILLGQPFIIGDGLTGTGSGVFQTFLVPDGATRLYLGLVDGGSFQGSPGAYADNVGSLSVTYDIEDGTVVSVAPEPGTLLLLATGLIGLLATARRNRARVPGARGDDCL